MLTKRKIITVTVALSAITGAIAWRGHSTTPPPDKATEDTRAEVATLRDKLARFEAAAVWQAATVTQQARTPTPAIQELAQNAAEKPPSPPSHPPDALEYTAQLDEKFRAQAPDPHWSQKGIEDAIRALSTDLTPGSRLGTVDCKADLCRIETSHEDLAAYRLFMQSALLSRDKKLWNGALNTQVISQSPTGVTAVTFIAREGREVPPAEPVLD